MKAAYQSGHHTWADWQFWGSGGAGARGQHFVLQLVCTLWSVCGQHWNMSSCNHCQRTASGSIPVSSVNFQPKTAVDATRAQT